MSWVDKLGDRCCVLLAVSGVAWILVYHLT